MKRIVGLVNSSDRGAEFGRVMTGPKPARLPGVPAGLGTRPADAVAPRCGDLWMINHHGSTILRCRCLEASSAAIRLCVPIGYGVAVGQQYELRSHVAGAQPASGLGGVAGSQVTVQRIAAFAGQPLDRLDVIATLDWA